MIRIKSNSELKKMHRSGQIARRILRTLGQAVAPGVTTRELDKLARELSRQARGSPSFLGYRGFPAAICASTNEVVVHGIPNSRKLQEGDILGIDYGIRLHGYHGDTAWTFAVGTVSPQALHLMQVTEQCLWEAIKVSVVGNTVGDISYAIQHYAESHGCNAVRDLVGHGVGKDMHEEPQVPNYGNAGEGPPLRPGMTLAIEPMITAGSYEVRSLEDGWTVVTLDGSLSAHYEHTVAILSDGPEILTAD